MSDRVPVAVREVQGGVLLKVWASPGASRTELRGCHGDSLKVAVSAPPEKGKANQAVAQILARHLGLRPSQVRLHTGATARDKWYLLEGITADELTIRLRRTSETE